MTTQDLSSPATKVRQPAEQFLTATGLQELSATYLRTLSEPGVLGYFTHFEVTEVVALFGGNPPVNVFSILVAEERVGPQEDCLQWLGQRISLNGLKGAKFGVCRYTRTVEEVLNAIDQLQLDGSWRLSGHPLRMGSAELMVPQFVPPNSNHAVTLNKILKNNFWDGCYVVEIFDHVKADLKVLLDTPELLLELSEKISKLIPIRIAEAADRLGNLMLQLPINVVRTVTAANRGSQTLSVELAWHPNAAPRPLTLYCITEFDKLVSGFNAIHLNEGLNEVSMPTLADEHRVIVWDESYAVILSASCPSSFVQQISFGMSVSAKDRIFTLPDGREQRVDLRAAQRESWVGDAPRPHKEWVWKRIHDEEAASLAAQRRFKQYLPLSGAGNAEHLKALRDLHFLMDNYGEGGVWLWDPYLNAHDILKTLFFSPHEGVQLRAMSTAQKARGLTGEESVQSWIHNQNLALSNCQSDFRGLNLEFRARHGDVGWDFHDRFIIFPGAREGVLAWSLGISVNQFGKSHHILQRVDNGRLIAEAFESLWNQLGTEDQLVWKWPRLTES